MKTTSVLPVAVAIMIVAVVSCSDPAAVVDSGLQLSWISPPPDTLREGDSAQVGVQVTDLDGQPVLDFDGATVSLRFVAPGDSQPTTACGDACSATVTDGRVGLTVAWVSAGSWTATACLARPDGGDELCTTQALTVLPVQAVLVVFPADSIGRRERFTVEAQLRLPNGSAVTDLAPYVRLRFGPDDAGTQVRCPEDGPLCERAPVAGTVRLDSVSVLDTVSTTIEACAVAPNGDERCDPAGGRTFQVVVPRAMLRFLTQPASGSAGVLLPAQPAVEVVEPDGTRRSDFTGSISLRLQNDASFGAVLAGDGPDLTTARGTLSATALLGVATFSGVRVNRAAAYHMVAEASATVPDTSAAFTVVLNASALAIATYEGDNQVAPPGAALPVLPAVRVMGPGDDPIAAIPVRFTVQAGAGTIAAEWDTTDATGIARAGTWTLGSSTGSQALSATAAGFAPVTFSALAEAILFEQLAFITTPPDTVVAGDTLPPIVIELQDTQGRRVVGGTDSVRVVASGNNSLPIVQVAVDGRLIFDTLTVTRAGDLQLIAWDARYPLYEPEDKHIGAPFHVAPRVQSAGLNFTSGGAEATVGFAVDPVPTVELVDPYGNFVAGHTVTFTATIGDGSVTGATQVTNNSGTAHPDAWILGPVPGANALSATAEGLEYSPVRFATGIAPTFNLTGISAGLDFTCAPAVVTNQPYCWGANATSQLGDGTQTARSLPVELSGGLLPMTQISAGATFACGIAVANGGAYCWGSNYYGQLGIGTADLDQHATPEGVLGDHVFQQISAGFTHVCALDTDGAAWCWGSSTEGALGSAWNARYEPSPVAGGLTFTRIDVGALHSCGIADAGAMWCWGANDYGQAGVNDSLTARFYAPQLVVGGRTFTDLSAGGSTTCGVSEGSPYCWGRNVEGQVGQGSTTDRWILAPAFVVGALGTTQIISVGTRHACSVNTVGETFCWGDNGHGQLGDGTTTLRSSGVALLGGPLFVAISAGQEHTCGLRQSGGSYCWGYNASGRLGLGYASNTNVTTPQPVVVP